MRAVSRRACLSAALTAMGDINWSSGEQRIYFFLFSAFASFFFLLPS